MAESGETAGGGGGGWVAAIGKFGVLALILAALGAFAWRYNLPLGEVRDLFARANPGLRYGVFAGIFALVSVAPVPARDVMKVAGAIFFGGLVSAFLVWAGEMGAAALAWGLGRLLGKDLIDRLLEGRLQGMQRKIEGATWRHIALLRVFPGTPYRFFNYAAPLTTIRPGPYFVGCLIGTFPRTLGFQLLFGAMGDAVVGRGVTTFQTVVVSIVFAAAALGFWAVYSRRGATGEKK